MRFVSRFERSPNKLLDAFGNLAVELNLYKYISGFRINLLENGIRPSGIEVPDAGFKLKDVASGPFNL